MKNPIRLIVSRDEEKIHSLDVVFGNDYGFRLGIQWRGYDPNDDGNDPWMLYVTALCWRTVEDYCGRTHRYSGPTWKIIKPQTRIHYTKRLSLALQRKSYWRQSYLEY